VVSPETAAALVAEGLSELSHETAESNQQAVALFERALEIDSRCAPAYVALAKAYLERVGDLRDTRQWLERALVAGEKALELDPAATDAYLPLGLAYRAKGALRKELALWQRRLQLASDDAVARTRGGWVLWFTGRPDEAVSWLHAAAAEQPESKYVHRWGHFFLGNAYLALGDFPEAKRMYTTALELYPDHSSAQAGVIWSLLAANNDDEARMQLQRFQTASFDGDRYPLKLADIEYFLGEDDSAAEHARQALAEPDERYWPRGFLASTILGAHLSDTDAAADEHLTSSEDMDRDRLAGGDEGYMPHVDLAAVAAIRGDARAACRSLRAATAAGWRYGPLATRDRLFENVRTDDEFRSLLAA